MKDKRQRLALTWPYWDHLSPYLTSTPTNPAHSAGILAPHIPLLPHPLALPPLISSHHSIGGQPPLLPPPLPSPSFTYLPRHRHISPPATTYSYGSPIYINCRDTRPCTNSLISTNIEASPKTEEIDCDDHVYGSSNIRKSSSNDSAQNSEEIIEKEEASKSFIVS